MEPKDLPGGRGRIAFAVYLAGDNNLSEEMVWSLQEMNAASREPQVRDRIDLAAIFDPLGGAPRRYDFSTSTSLSASEPARPTTEDPGKLLGELVAGMGPVRRILVLSGHGSGAVGDFLSDENPASSLSIPRLGRILGETSFEILGLDSCQMSTVEVGYEVRKSVSCLVASEGPVLNSGWPYRQVLGSVAENGAGSPEEIGRAVASSYLRFYRDYEIAGVSTDIGVTDLTKLGRVAEASSELARAMTDPLSELAPDGLEEGIELGELARSKETSSDAKAARAVRDAIVLAHWSAQSYKCDRYTDLHDFARQLLRFSAGRSGGATDEIRKACRLVLDAVAAAVVSSGTTGAELQHSHGLSIYFPWSHRDFFPEYRNLRFARETGWVKFLEAYLRSTSRMRRFQPANLKAPMAPAAPRRAPFPSPDAAPTKDVEAGTRKGQTCRSTMKNPPEGYYSPPGGE
jgi:hypothetical protein